jgi:glycosidase
LGNDAQRVRLALMCLFTLPGPPVVYYGTEVSVGQRRPCGRFEESRLPMLWDGVGIHCVLHVQLFQPSPWYR